MHFSLFFFLQLRNKKKCFHWTQQRESCYWLQRLVQGRFNRTHGGTQWLFLKGSGLSTLTHRTVCLSNCCHRRPICCTKKKKRAGFLMAVPKDRDRSRAASLHMQRITFIARKQKNSPFTDKYGCTYRRKGINDDRLTYFSKIIIQIFLIQP